jgi:hypothetical protein
MVVMEVIRLEMKILYKEESSVDMVALVAVTMLVNMVAMQMATMDMVMTEAILVVVEAMASLAVTTINIQIFNPGGKKVWS